MIIYFVIFKSKVILLYKYLPCLDSDAVHCVVHHDISDGDVRDTGFRVIPP